MSLINPTETQRLRAAMDAAGNVTAWESDFFIPAGPGGLDVPLRAAALAGLPQQPVPFPGNDVNAEHRGRSAFLQT